MVPLPLFKLASLFVRHISKYGANRIKAQAHDHPGFRAFAAKYGQGIHQLNMRMSVALLRNKDAELRAKEKAEAPTVKTKEQIEKQEQLKAKYGTTAKESHASKPAPTSLWRRRFRPLPEAKAVDLFADVAGDSFILLVGGALIIYEYYRSSGKPDTTKEKVEALTAQLEELRRREQEREDDERRQRERIQTLEDALRNVRDPKTKKPVLTLPAPTAS